MHVYKKHFNRQNFVYPPLYFISKFPGTEIISYGRRIRYNMGSIIFREIESRANMNNAIDSFKDIFMNTKVLHASKSRREFIWRLIKNWDGTMAQCIKKCNEIYYDKLTIRSPRKSALNLPI